MLGCSVRADLLATEEALDELSVRCPVTIAWSEHDRIFPPDQHVSIAKQRVPGARFVTLAGVGHVPMFDDPHLVAQTILETTSAATRRASGEQPFA